jgi:hypothetical protein
MLLTVLKAQINPEVIFTNNTKTFVAGIDNFPTKDFGIKFI